MAENSNIEWTDHTFNPVWGCTQIAPGCDNCYAKEIDQRFNKGAFWGPKNMPRRTNIQNWNKVRKWNKSAEITGQQVKVFCASMADICDKNWEPAWREDLWQLIRETPSLTWQLLTKRATLIEKYIPLDIRMLPNVWLGVTAEDQKHGVERASQLSQIECNLRWMSIEPLLEQIKIPAYIMETMSWIVIGGESGSSHRPIDASWVSSIIKHADLYLIPVFFKQWGGKRPKENGCLLNGVELKQFPLGAMA